MKTLSRKTTHINYTIDYENGIICDALTINGKLQNYSFSLNKTQYYYIENIDELLSTRFSDHWNFINPKRFKKLTELKEFTDFDNLFYVGSSRDGMVKDINDKFKSSLVLLDSTFFPIWTDVKGKEQCEDLKLKIDKHTWVSKCDVVDYQDYEDYSSRDFSLRIEVTPDGDFLNKTLNELKATYINEEVKIKIFNEISK